MLTWVCKNQPLRVRVMDMSNLEKLNLHGSSVEELVGKVKLKSSRIAGVKDIPIIG